MPTRNTAILQEIVQVLDSPEALARLENHFKSSLLVVAGNEIEVAQHAEDLRLAIIEAERGPVLDYIKDHQLAKITIDDVEEAINALYPDRFIEP